MKRNDPLSLGVPSTKKTPMLDRSCGFLVRHRLAVLLITLIVTVGLGLGVVKLRGEVILQDLFPHDHPYLKLQATFARVFGGGGSGVVVVVKAKDGDIFNENVLTKIQQMTNEVAMWDEVYRVLTTSIASPSVKVVKAKGKGEISIESLMWPDIPRKPEEMELLRKHLFTTPAYRGNLVSRDGTACLLLTEFKENISYERAFLLLQSLVNKYSDKTTTIHIVGFPQLMGWIYSYKHQVMIVFAVSILLMAVILFLVFRTWMGIVPPMLFGLMTALMGLGFMGWTGINFSPLLYVLAFLVGARVISHSVQITHRYLEEFAKTGDNIDACRITMQAMMTPALAGISTDAAGFAVLFLAKIALMQQLAVSMTFWLITVGTCGVLTPIICSYMPLRKASEKWSMERAKVDWLGRSCAAIARYSITSGKVVGAVTFVAIFAFCIWSASESKIGDPTAGSPLLWPDHRYNRDQAVINETFDASSENYVLYYEGVKESVYDPHVLHTFDAFARHMEKKLPDIYKSSGSIIDTVRMVNVTLHDGDQLWYELPTNETVLTSIMGYIRQNTTRGTLNRFIDDVLERAQITLFFSDHTSDNLVRIRDAATEFFKDRSMKTEKGEFKLAGGRVGMEMAVNAEMARSHTVIDAMVLAMTLLLCVLCYRSIVGGLMLTLPLIFANLVAFAYMSASNIGLSVNTLPVAAIGVGVGVDYAMYIYSRCQEEFQQQNGWMETILVSVRTAGKAVVYTGLVMILPIISWYFLCDLKFQAQMGIFIAMIMGTNVVLALTLHPLLIYIIKPKFISRGLPMAEERKPESGVELGSTQASTHKTKGVTGRAEVGVESAPVEP